MSAPPPPTTASKSEMHEMLHSGARGNLLSSIQGGQKLKKTETRDCSAPELTDAIQQELMAGGSENYYLDLSRPREVAAVRGTAIA